MKRHPCVLVPTILLALAAVAFAQDGTSSKPAGATPEHARRPTPRRDAGSLDALRKRARTPPNVPGVRLRLKSGGSVSGVLTSEADGRINLRVDARDEVYAATDVRAVEACEVPATCAETPRVLYEAELRRIAPHDADADAQLAAALLAESVGLPREAKERYEKLKAADPTYEPLEVDRAIADCEARLTVAAWREDLAAARDAANTGDTRVALRALEDLGARLKQEASIEARAILRDAEALRERIMKRAHEGARVQVRDAYLPALKRRLRTLAADGMLDLPLRKSKVAGLHEAVASELAARYGLSTPEVDELWRVRSLNSAQVATYFTGSFILLGARERTGSRRGLPTPEAWWSGASTDQRAEWMLALWAESSGKVDVVREDWRECPECGGRGVTVSVAVRGRAGYETNVCRACHGHGRFKGLLFR